MPGYQQDAAGRAALSARQAQARRDVERKTHSITVSGARRKCEEHCAGRKVYPRRFNNKKDIAMRKLLLPLAASILLSSAALAQTSDTKAPATTGPAAQSGDNMSKGDMSKDKMSKPRKMAKKKSTKMDDKM
jgi:hypothetical protein